MTTDYSTMADAELNVAVHKAIGDTQPFVPAYSTDANLALSLLNDWCKSDPRGRRRWWNAGNGGDGIGVCLQAGTGVDEDAEAYGADDQPTFARAICIALLSAQEEGQ